MLFEAQKCRKLSIKGWNITSSVLTDIEGALDKIEECSFYSGIDGLNKRDCEIVSYINSSKVKKISKEFYQRLCIKVVRMHKDVL